MSAVLEVADVIKRYDGHTAVDRVSFKVEPGRIFGLLGPNGAGKTTTIRIVMDIIAPDDGYVRLFGARRDGETNTRIGYLPEERGLYRKMTVEDHLIFLAEIRGVSRGDARPRIHDWLARMELTDWTRRKVEELSKGMQQKVQFIATVINDPPLLILDEPFTGLDPINTVLLKDFMSEARDQGKAIIFSTHVLEQAEKLCDDICLIKNGRIILEGTIEEVRARYRRPAYLVKGTNLERLADLAMVEHMTPDGDYMQVELRGPGQGRDFLQAALATASLTEFRPQEPDLESIFIQAVRDASE